MIKLHCLIRYKETFWAWKSSASVKPDIQNFEIEIRPPCCWTVLTFWNISVGYLTQTFNSLNLRLRIQNIFEIIFFNFWVIKTSPKRYSQKFSKLNWEKIARRQLLKSQNCLKITSMTKLSPLFVLYFLSL